MGSRSEKMSKSAQADAEARPGVKVKILLFSEYSHILKSKKKKNIQNNKKIKL